MKPGVKRENPKREYLEKIRFYSSYPTFRFCIAVVKVLSYLIAIIAALVGALAAVNGSLGMGVLTILGSIVISIMAKAAYEASVMIADMVDSILDHNARQEASGSRNEQGGGSH